MASQGVLMAVPVVRMQLIRERDQAYRVKRESISTSDQVAALLAEYLGDCDREEFVVVCLDAKLHVICVTTVHIGTLMSSVVGARDVFKAGLLANAASLIVAHNHPSGDPTPSPEDVAVTARLAALGKQLDMPVYDHIIIGERRHFSFASKAMMPQG